MQTKQRVWLTDELRVWRGPASLKDARLWHEGVRPGVLVRTPAVSSPSSPKDLINPVPSAPWARRSYHQGDMRKEISMAESMHISMYSVYKSMSERVLFVCSFFKGIVLIPAWRVSAWGRFLRPHFSCFFYALHHHCLHLSLLQSNSRLLPPPSSSLFLSLSNFDSPLTYFSISPDFYISAYLPTFIHLPRSLFPFSLFISFSSSSSLSLSPSAVRPFIILIKSSS